MARKDDEEQLKVARMALYSVNLLNAMQVDLTRETERRTADMGAIDDKRRMGGDQTMLRMELDILFELQAADLSKYARLYRAATDGLRDSLVLSLRDERLAQKYREPMALATEPAARGMSVFRKSLVELPDLSPSFRQAAAELVESIDYAIEGFKVVGHVARTGRVPASILPPQIPSLADELNGIQPGADDATEYERLVARVLTEAFAGRLIHPNIQYRQNQGRKRVDIKFTNNGGLGFFGWLQKSFQCPDVFVECKNYSSDPGNPEVDQLLGRLGAETGVVGVLCVRSVDNEDLLIARCRDAFFRDRKIILPLRDADLIALHGASVEVQFAYLKAIYDKVAQ
jgi:hypothetical protein